MMSQVETITGSSDCMNKFKPVSLIAIQSLVYRMGMGTIEATPICQEEYPHFPLIEIVWQRDSSGCVQSKEFTRRT